MTLKEKVIGMTSSSDKSGRLFFFVIAHILEFLHLDLAIDILQHIVKSAMRY